MMNNPSVKRRSLRIQLPPPGEDHSLVVPPPDAAAAQTKPKSILRNRRDEVTTNTTEPASPLHSESYFVGPLRTLIVSVEDEESGAISIHDITEAYILLSCRIEAQGANLGDEASPAIVAVRKLPLHTICAAIRRDVAYAIPGTKDLEELPSSQVALTDEERCRIKDRSSLCHAALRFLANFLRFSSLHQSVKVHELAWVFRELLETGLSYDLVTLNPQKTYSHIISTICSQRLPDGILKPLRSKISVVVERAASGGLGGSASKGPHLEGLRAIYALVHRHGPLLLPEFTTVFKVVLQNLVCPIPAFRDSAAKALTAFAHTILRSNIVAEDQLKFSSIVGSFIDKEVQRAKGANKRDPNSFVLRSFLKLSEDDPQIVQRVTQLLNIVAALLIISGPCVFIRPNSLKFLIKAVGKTQDHRYRELNVLRAATWSCLVRAYGLLSLWEIPRNDGLEESAFRVVRQEYQEDVSISVLAVVLSVQEEGARSLGRVREAIAYLHDLGQLPETRNISIVLLRRLLGGVLDDADSDTCTWSGPASVIAEWLSNGSTLEMEPRKLRKALSSPCATDIHTVRILEAEEIVATWEDMLGAFQVCAIGQLFDKKTANALQNETLLLWRALLRVKSALVPAFSRSIVAKRDLECIATALCAFLDAPNARYPIRSAQAFTATHQLWKLVNDELGAIWGATLSGSIYRRLLKACQYEVAGGTMGDEWAQLSRSLVSAAPKRTFEILAELHDVDAERVLWLDMVRFIRYQEQPSKEVILCLLRFPIQVLENILNDEMDMGYWDRLFMLALMHDEPESVYAVIAEELRRALTSSARTGVRKFLVSSVSHASYPDSPLSIALLSVVSDYLEEAYPPGDSGNNELVELVPALQKIITTYPSLDAINALKDGLAPWFEDRNVHISDDIYNDDVLSLYCDLISVIQRILPMENAVVELAELLVTPFQRERIPKPAVGPIAFKQFWDSVGPTLTFDSRTFPPVLTECIISLHSAFSGYVPEWMASQLESDIHSSDIDLIIPPSVEDLESSDFSLASFKRRANLGDSPPTRKGTKAAPILTPDVSPSVGEPSPQFARYRPEVISSPLVSLDPGRISKKRKVLQSRTPNKRDHPGDNPVRNSSPSRERLARQLVETPLDDVPVSLAGNMVKHNTMYHDDSAASEIDASPLRQGIPPTSLMQDEDYTSWEIRVGSQDLQGVLGEDDDETPRPLDPSPDIQDGGRRTSLRLRERKSESHQMRMEHPVDRSQTAPACLQSSSDDRQGADEASSSGQAPINAKLRRMHTTNEVPLDALEKLHARLSEEADCMQTQDLAQATKLTYDVLGLLNGRMSEKLEKRK